MSRGIRKPIIMNNPKMRAMMFSIDGTGTTPAASGFDASQVLSVTDNGTGDYTIVLKYPFNVKTELMALVSSKTAGVQAYVTAVDHDRVTVEGVDTTDGSTAADCDFDIWVVGNDGKLNY